MKPKTIKQRRAHGVPVSPQVDLEKVARQIARVMRIQIHNLCGKGQQINSPDNASNKAWLDDRSSDDAKLILPLLSLPESSGVPICPEGKVSNYDTPETMVDHIVGMVADDGSITDYARGLAIDYIRTRLKYAAPSASVEVNPQANVEEEAR